MSFDFSKLDNIKTINNKENTFDFNKLDSIKKSKFYFDDTTSKNKKKKEEQNIQNEIIQNRNTQLSIPTNDKITEYNNNRKNQMKEIGNSTDRTLQNVTNQSTSNSNGINNPLEFLNKAKTEVLPNVTKDIAQGILNRAGYIAENVGAGVISGVTGIAQGGLTDVANQLEKGSKSEKNIAEQVIDNVTSIANILNPMGSFNNIIKNAPQKALDNIELFKDNNKNILEKFGEFLVNNTSDVINSSATKAALNDRLQLIGKINPNTSKDVLKINDTISEPVYNINKNLAEKGKDYDPITQYLGSGAQAVGNMVPSMAMTWITKNPEVGLATMGLSVKGQATQEALNKGATLDQAVKIGDTKAAIEIGTEMLSGGVNIFGKGAVDDIIEKGINKKVKNEILNYFAKQGVGVSGELVEEYISDILGTVIDKGTVDPDATYTLNDFKDTTITTILSTLGINAISGVYTKNNFRQNAAELQNFNNQNKNLPQNQLNNENILQRQQVNQQNNKMAQNGFLKQIENNVENNQETLYNNNESESDLYGKQTIKPNEQRGNAGLFPQYEGRTTNDIGYQGNNEKQNKWTKQEELEYIRKPENQITNLNNNQNKIKEAFESKGAKVAYYSLDSNKGGYCDNGTLYINQKDISDTEQLKIAKHEYTHHLIRNNVEFNQKIKPLAEQIIKNEETGVSESIRDYIMSKDIRVEEVNEVYERAIEEILAEYAMNIDNYTDFNKENEFGVDTNILEEYKSLLQDYMPLNVELENSEKSSINLPSNKKNNINPKSPKTKQELLDNNSKALNKYIQEKNNSIRNIESQIKEYNNKLNSIQDRNSVEANKIKLELIELNNKLSDIELLYNKKIDKAIEKGQKLIDSLDMSGRRTVIQKNRELAREKIQNIAKWKDKSNGLKYQRETMERNMFDIIPSKQEAQDIINTYFEPIHVSEANKQRFINKYNDLIKELNLNKYEAEAVQLLGEQKYNPDFKADDVKPVLDRVNKNIKNKKIDRAKVDNAIEVFRSTYDELFELENEALIANGYPPKPYRKGYFPHFIDAEPVTNTERFLDKLGFKIDKRPLPTDIAGITEQFVPGKTWNRSALKRKTDTTTYNALKGFDTYISQAADNIFHTENIQKLRALENEIRYQYSEKGIQDRIDEIYNNDTLTQDEQQSAIERIFEQVENPMPNLVTELRRYTNALANKKSEADRSAEQKYGRQLYSTVNAIENRFGANAVGLNIGSAVTNFIPITQAYSQVSTKNMGRAVIDTIKSYINDDGFINNSTFLTNRLNQSEKLFKTSLEKISDKTSFLFNAIDSVASNIVVRGKYLQNIDEGMNVQEAMKNADRFGANLMADRSKGAMPTLFNEKSPITKAFTQFQLEVNNQYSYMFKDIPRDMKDKGIAHIALAFFKMFIAAFLYNKASEEVVGRKAAFSPIDIAIDSYKTLSDENTSTADKIINVSKDVAEDLPFIGGFLGGGRIPVSGALPDAENTFKAATGLVTGEMDSNKALSTLGKELAKPGYYLLPPFGGGQLKKTIEGVNTVAKGGSYGVDSKGNETLQFPVENANAADYIKAGLFGKYSLNNAKEYANRGYKSLNTKQTQIYKEAKIPYKELLDYIDQGLSKKEDKISYIEDQDLNENQKWGIYKYDILSSTERKDGGSQLSDAEYMINNGMTKKQYMDMYNTAQKNNIDIPTEIEYKKLKKNGINVNNYIDYKVKEKQYKNDNGELKDKDKIQILINSNYSNKETKAMYEELIKNANDSKYDILNKAGIDIKEYLKYKQQDFESDKTKTYNYVNNMKINYNQRLLLLGMQYSLTSDEKTKLANYVNTMNLSKQEKIEIYSKIKGFKVYDDGRITW